MDVETRSLLGRTHFQNANLFKDKVMELEAIFGNEDCSDIPQTKSEEHKAYCFSSILSSLSFLDAQANEFVKNVRDDDEHLNNGRSAYFYPNIRKEYRKRIIHASNLDDRFKNASPPVKYNVLLDVMGLDEFDRDNEPLEELVLLNRLRNELTHFSPEWVQVGPKNYTENEYGFETELRQRFELSPLAAEGSAFFPDQCMSYGCTEWAVRNSRTLVYHFGLKVDINPRSIN